MSNFSFNVRMLLGEHVSLNSQVSVHIQTLKNKLYDLILFTINVKVFFVYLAMQID